MISVKYELSVEDYVNFNYLHWNAPFNSDVRTKSLLNYIALVILGAFGMASLLSWVYQKRMDSTFLIIMLIILGVLVIEDHFVFKKKSIRNKTHQFLENAVNRNVLLPAELTIDHTGIRSVSAVADVCFKWDTVEKVYETNAYFFLFVNTIQALIIPKNVLTPEDAAYLQATVQSKIHEERIFIKK